MNEPTPKDTQLTTATPKKKRAAKSATPSSLSITLTSEVAAWVKAQADADDRTPSKWVSRQLACMKNLREGQLPKRELPDGSEVIAS